MKSFKNTLRVLSFLLCTVPVLLNAQSEFRAHAYTDLWRGLRTDTLFPSGILGYEKNISIFTPQDFRKLPGEQYPLIIMFDRQGLELTNFLIHSVDVLETTGQIPRMVAVSIESGGLPGDRTREAKWSIDGGDAYGEKFDEFVFSELVPYMIDHYSIDRNQIIVYGHSWFGYHSSMILVKHIPDLFAVISASPCCLSTERIDEIVQAVKNTANRNRKFFFRVASGHDIGDNLDVYRELTGKISMLRLPEMFDYKPTWYYAAMHFEVPLLLFLQSLYEIYAVWADLAFAYSDPQNNPTYNDVVLYDSLQQQCDKFYGFRIPFSDRHIEWRSEYYRFVRNEKVTFEGRVATWKFMVSKYGAGPEAYYNIASNYYLLHQADSAKVYLDRLLSLQLTEDWKQKAKELTEEMTGH